MDFSLPDFVNRVPSILDTPPLLVYKLSEETFEKSPFLLNFDAILKT